MKIITFIKKLNNTELGKGNTHDSYILVPSDSNLSDIFPQKDVEITFIDKESGKKYAIRKTEGREIRIPGLGPYFTDKKLVAGDEVVLEKRELNGQATYFISANKYNHLMMIRKERDAFVLMNPERLNLINEDTMVSGKKCELVFKESRPKRSDSPEMTDYYNLIIDGFDVSKNYSYNETIELIIDGGNSHIEKPSIWKKFTLVAED